MQTGLLAAIYAKKGDSAELERLTQLYMIPSEYTSEHWLIFGYHYYVLKKYDKASYFAHKACYLNPRNIEAGLLKGILILILLTICTLYILSDREKIGNLLTFIFFSIMICISFEFYNIISGI